MIESTIRNYLTSVLSVPVYLELPKDPPASYVVLQKTGSTESNGLRTATMAAQSIADTLYEAATLSELVITEMKAAVLTNVFRVELNSDYNFTNTNTKKHRYQAVFNITYKE